MLSLILRFNLEFCSHFVILLDYTTVEHNSYVAGVTLWEMFSYGKRPYENTPTMDLPELLESGKRLPRLSICTSAVHTLMDSCEYL